MVESYQRIRKEFHKTTRYGYLHLRTFMNDQYLFSLKKHLIRLSRDLDGELLYDELVKRLYATDASVYRIIPLAVAFPKHSDDLKKLILFAQQYSCSLIPRTAGTSLAGQCVGEGIVVDFSKYFTDIISFDKEKALVTVQPVSYTHL